ncbi:MAG: wax ester/triacylglycerol synthase family O-acyltransferase [Actinobacteria bacterium]|nr:wax ester/triacylglycerol synthase family O-acyltransferase [Actinomycetota bacterium]
MSGYDRLSGLDASFLVLERIETPMHIGSLAILEGRAFFDERGRFRLADVRRLVSSRLHLIPRFRKRVMEVPLGLGRPVWVDDARFDVGYHVRLTALPAPGSRAQLLALFERVQAQLLDRSRPLWELWFVEGLEGGQVALFQKTHHALVDGISGVDVATVLFDFSPEPTVPDAPEWEPTPAPSPQQLLVDTVVEEVGQVTHLGRMVADAVQVPQRALAQLGQLGRSMATLAEGRLLAPRLSINRPVGRHRRFLGVQVPLDDVKAVRGVYGGTINDVVLAGVAGGLARLLDARGELRPDLRVKVMCPVSVRADQEHLALGNRVSALVVPLAVGATDPVSRLASVRAATEDLKERHQAVAADTLIGLTQYAAPTLLGLAARAAHHQVFFNLISTNVPGPQVPLYCMGAQMVEAYPMVPLSRNLGLGIAILSYCGNLHIGLLADRDAFPDLDVLATGIAEAFTEMRDHAEAHGIDEPAPDADAATTDAAAATIDLVVEVDVEVDTAP